MLMAASSPAIAAACRGVRLWTPSISAVPELPLQHVEHHEDRHDGQHELDGVLIGDREDHELSPSSTSTSWTGSLSTSITGPYSRLRRSSSMASDTAISSGVTCTV